MIAKSTHSWEKLEHHFQTIIGLCLDGEEMNSASFSVAWSAVEPQMIHTARCILRGAGSRNDQEEAFEAVQNWYAQMQGGKFQKYRLTNGGRPFYPFGCKLLEHECIDLRRRVRRCEMLDQEVSRSGANVSREIESQEDREEVRSAISQLSPEVQDVLTAKYWDGLKSCEISQRLGIAVSAVNGRAFRGRQKLAELLPRFNSF